MKEYAVKINGVDHVFQLSDEDAKLRGLTSKDVKGEATVSETPLDFGTPTTDGQQTEAKAKAAANKAATPENKG